MSGANRSDAAAQRGRIALVARLSATTASLLVALAIGVLSGLGGAAPVETAIPGIGLVVSGAALVSVVDAWLFVARPWASTGFALVASALALPVVAQVPGVPPIVTAAAAAAVSATIVGAGLIGCSFGESRSARRIVGIAGAVLAVTLAWSILVVDPRFEPGCLRVCLSTGAPFATSVPPFAAVVIESVGITVAAAIGIVAIARCRASTPAGIVVSAGLVVLTAAVCGILRPITWAGTEVVLIPLALPAIASLVLSVFGLAQAIGELVARKAVARIVAAFVDGRDEDLVDRVQFQVDGGEWIDSTGAVVDERRDWATVEQDAAGRTRVAATLGSASPNMSAAWFLTLENARLIAMARRRTRELREAQRQIVRTSDGEARRLQRDLHDGAQQRLVSALFFLSAGSRDEDQEVVRAAQTDVRQALAELREISHGLLPESLKSEGVWSALREVARQRAIEVDWTVPPVELDDDASDALFVSVMAALDGVENPARGIASVAAERDDHVLRTRISVAGIRLDVERFVQAADRLGAVGGALAATAEGGLEVTVPCAS